MTREGGDGSVVSDYCQRIEAHYSEVWSAPSTRKAWQKGPTYDLPDGFCVLSLRRSEDTHAYATCCMSQPGDEERLELHLITPVVADRAHEESLIEALVAVAHYHRTGATLGLGHTVNLGRPWVPGSSCTHGLVSLPYLDGPDLEWLETPRVRFLWLVPITEAELQYKKRNGLEALEAMFEEKQFKYLDLRRQSVV